MKMIKQIWKGSGFLEGYGRNEGNDTFVCFVGFGFFIGLFFDAPLVGVLIALAILGPVWLYGCYLRAEDYDKLTKVMKGEKNA